MAVIDTLQILIEADRSGLESQLRRAGATIQQFVNSMNKQEISWTQILSKSITPALIATIASTFALAVTQALQFQQQMAAVGATLPDGLAGGISAAAGVINTLVQNTGQNSSDLNQTYGAMLKQFNGNATAAEEVTNQLGMLATMGIAPLGDLTSQAIGLFQAWNVTTGTDAVTALNGMYQAFQGGHLQWSQLAQDLINNGAAFHTTNTSITDVADNMAAMSQEAGVTGEDVKNVFDTMGKNIMEGAAGPLNGVLGGFSSMGSRIDKEGVKGALNDIQGYFSKLSQTTANAIGKSVDLSPDTISAFRNSSKEAWSTMIESEDTAIGKLETISQKYKDFMAISPSTGLMNKIESGIGTGATQLSSFISQVWETFADIEGFNGMKAQSDTSATVGQGLMTQASSVLNNPLLSSMASGAGGIGISGGFQSNTNVTDILQQILSALLGSSGASNTTVNIKANSPATQSATKAAGYAASSSQLPNTQ